VPNGLGPVPLAFWSAAAGAAAATPAPRAMAALTSIFVITRWCRRFGFAMDTVDSPFGVPMGTHDAARLGTQFVSLVR
jgi:hypothetical protein